MPMYVIFQKIMRVTEISIEINKTLRDGHSEIIIVVIIVIEIIIHNSENSRVHINIIITMHIMLLVIKSHLIINYAYSLYSKQDHL